MKPRPLFKILFLFCFVLISCSSLKAQEKWQVVSVNNEAHERHENAFVKAGDKFYLIGGRGIKPTGIYDPATQTWTEGAPTPIEISHVQAISYEGLIYVMGGLTGNWPSETPLSHIYIYNPLLDKWFTGPKIPPHRQRGAAGVVVHDEKFYLVCGIVNGHTSGWVPWLDEFDPSTNTWSELPDAPRSRDHFQAVVAGNKLIAAGGRKSGFQGQGFEATIAETDIFDFETQNWSTLPSPEGDIPTQRAGTAAISAGNRAIVTGGESGTQTTAHNEVEALDPEEGSWRALPSLQTGRHGTQLIYSEGQLYIAAGSGDRGGGPELNSLEKYVVPGMDSSADEPVAAGTLNVSAEEHDFGSVQPSTTETATFEISNTGGNQGILLTYVIVTDSNEYSVDFPYQLPYVIGPGRSINVNINYTPLSSSPSEATLLVKQADRGGLQPKEITLRGNQE